MAKTPVSATIDEELIEWIDRQIKDKKRYRNRSHLIEIAIEALKEKGDK